MLDLDMHKGLRAASWCEQRGGFFKRDAVAQTVQMGCDPDEHFKQAVNFALEENFPLDAQPPLGSDVKFAAWTTAIHARTLDHETRLSCSNIRVA